MHIQVNKLEEKQQNKTKKSRRMDNVIIRRLIRKWKTKIKGVLFLVLFVKLVRQH